MDFLSVETIAQVGFPIAITLYLLYERSTFNTKITESLVKISHSMELIEQRLLNKIDK